MPLMLFEGTAGQEGGVSSRIHIRASNQVTFQSAQILSWIRGNLDLPLAAVSTIWRIQSQKLAMVSKPFFTSLSGLDVSIIH